MARRPSDDLGWCGGRLHQLWLERGIIKLSGEQMTTIEVYQKLLGEAAIEVWGDMPREIQEALFEVAIRDRPELRLDLAKLLHDRHPRTDHH